jgi:hypothetical protein
MKSSFFNFKRVSGDSGPEIHVARVWRRGDRPPSGMCLSGKYGETRNSCLLSVESGNGSRHLVFWSLGTLTSLRNQARELVV